MSNVNQDCTKIRQQLALFAGRDLEENLCGQVEQHLGGCEACRAELSKTIAARERIALFGSSNAQGLEALDLWPAVRASWSSERVALETEAAALNLSRPRSRVRRWLPLALAAAAALVIYWGWEAAPSLSIEPVAPPLAQNPIESEDVASHSDVADPTLVVDPLPQGSLRRAGPNEERLRDSSLPLGLPLRSLIRPAGDTQNSLAGDDGLR